MSKCSWFEAQDSSVYRVGAFCEGQEGSLGLRVSTHQILSAPTTDVSESLYVMQSKHVPAGKLLCKKYVAQLGLTICFDWNIFSVSEMQIINIKPSEDVCQRGNNNNAHGSALQRALLVLT